MKVKWIQISRSILAAYILSVIFLLILTIIFYQMQLDTGFLQGSIYVSYLAAGLAGGFLSGKQIKNRRLLWGIVTGAVYCFIWLMPALFQGQSIGDVFKVFPIVAALCLVGGAVGGIIS